jgi:hypothetical protein
LIAQLRDPIVSYIETPAARPLPSLSNFTNKSDVFACSAGRPRLKLSKKEKQFAVLPLPSLPECGSNLAFSRRTHVPATPRLRYPDGIPAEGINV